MRAVRVAARAYRARQPFRIARGAKTHAHQINVLIEENGLFGRGACVPYARYGETSASVLAQLTAATAAIEAGASRDALQGVLPAGAARNALDAALWDLEANASSTPVWRRAGLGRVRPLHTAVTVVIDTPDAMGEAAAALKDAPIIKAKLAGDGIDRARLDAVLAAAPGARFILDANESLDRAGLESLIAWLPPDRVALIEQPLAASMDAALDGLASRIALCADESFHLAPDAARLCGRYDAVNIKLDKTGGLTEALVAVQAARAAGLRVMVGCMLGSSLAMAPAFIAAQQADFVDLDGPLLLAEDDDDPIRYDGFLMHPPMLWGAGSLK